MILMSHTRNLKKPTLYMREPALFGAVTRRVSARDAIVDVANMRPNNIADLAAEYGGRVAYVSTHKTLQLLPRDGRTPAAGTGHALARAPRSVREARDHPERSCTTPARSASCRRGAIRLCACDTTAMRCAPSRRVALLRRPGRNTPSAKWTTSSSRTPAWPPGLPVYTHDRMLGRIVAGAMPLPRLDLPMTRLMGATRLTALEFRDGRWVVAHRK